MLLDQRPITITCTGPPFGVGYTMVPHQRRPVMQSVRCVRCVSQYMDRVKIAQWDPEKLADAGRVWTGYRFEMYPCRSEVRLVARFGAELASRLLPVLDELETEFYVSNAKYVAKDLAEMAEMAAREFQERFPTLPGEIAEAFAWCYTFDFK